MYSWKGNSRYLSSQKKQAVLARSRTMGAEKSCLIKAGDLVGWDLKFDILMPIITREYEILIIPSVNKLSSSFFFLQELNPHSTTFWTKVFSKALQKNLYLKKGIYRLTCSRHFNSPWPLKNWLHIQLFYKS